MMWSWRDIAVRCVLWPAVAAIVTGVGAGLLAWYVGGGSGAAAPLRYYDDIKVDLDLRAASRELQPTVAAYGRRDQPEPRFRFLALAGATRDDEFACVADLSTLETYALPAAMSAEAVRESETRSLMRERLAREDAAAALRLDPEVLDKALEYLRTFVFVDADDRFAPTGFEGWSEEGPFVAVEMEYTVSGLFRHDRLAGGDPTPPRLAAVAAVTMGLTIGLLSAMLTGAAGCLAAYKRGDRMA